MPIYETDDLTREGLLELRKTNQCKECDGPLAVFLDFQNHKAFLACWDWNRTHHDEGIERPASRYETEGMAALNIETRRAIMEQEHGKGTTTAIEKARLPMTGALTQSQAMHILKLVYPDVPEDQIVRTAIFCRDFGLHPLAKEVYILPFKEKSGGVNWATVVGIPANRKMAYAVKGEFSFIDDTPRAASQEEIIKQFGKGSDEEMANLISFCKLCGEGGNLAIGFGLWPKEKVPYGLDKGNTKRNMANIRAERQALDRLPGKAMPRIEVIDEAYAELPDIGKVDKKTGEIIDSEAVTPTLPDMPEPSAHWCEEHNCAFELKTSRFGSFYSHKVPGGYHKEGKDKPEASETEASAVETKEEPPPPGRDPASLRTLNDLFKACNEDFNLQPADVIKELNVASQTDISDTPAECFRRIRAVRTE